MNDDEGFISEESDQNNYQLKLPKDLFIDTSVNIQIPLHNIEQKCVYLKHKQTTSYNFKYHFNGLLLDDNKLIKSQPIISNGMFNSNFESANLYAAYEIKDNEFNLILQDDTNTMGYSQWFYFEVNNPQGQVLTFHIINLIKEYKSLKYGLSVMIKDGFKWEILETNVKLKSSQYYKLKYPTLMCKLYQLSIIIPSKHKKFKLSLNYPYTNTDLYAFLKNDYQILTTSLSGFKIPILRYGSPNNDVIVIIARQHPGETVSSFVCQGFLSSLEKDEVLTQRFHFIVIPLFNPDGVDCGNFRCDLSGKDLNRQWHKPNPQLHSQIIETKNLLKTIIQTRNIVCFVDLHGHSKKLNSFMYSCRGDQDVVQSRILPFIFKTTSKYFDFNSCTFSLEPCKMKTARAFVYKLVKKHFPNEIHDIFTLETSFFGYNEFYQIKQFTQQDLLQIGQDLYKSLLLYYTNVNLKQQVAIELEKNRQQYTNQDLYSTEDQSDSDPENGMIVQKQPKQKKRFEKKVSIKKEISFIKKLQQPQLNSFNNQNYENIRYFSMPKSKIEKRQMKSSSFHQQMNITQSQIKDISVDITPTNKFKLKTQQSNNNQEMEQSQQQILIPSQKKQNFQFQKTNFVPPIHNGLSIKVVHNKIKSDQFQQQQQLQLPFQQQQIRLNQSFQSTQYNSPENKNLAVISKSIQKKDTWDPRLIFEFTQKVKRKNTQNKFN
ncbi:unnamed protein product [Paramecium octaurelia]|uniref:Peptidase M14 domain-containing protein n=1 Tax=Paramecium octaurelia TaxID=43137 RepID=A0A8S1V318_PAROT|nr:unnamed protein product [Paramecium octaurelia]